MNFIVEGLLTTMRTTGMFYFSCETVIMQAVRDVYTNFIALQKLYYVVLKVSCTP